MPEDKICPIMVLAGFSSKRYLSTFSISQGKCIRENCAWWLEEAGYCSFNALGWVMGDIDKQLTTIKKILEDELPKLRDYIRIYTRG